MNKSLEALKNRIATLRCNNRIGSRDIANQEILEIAMFLENHIVKDLELLEQLKQQRDSLAINNGELVVKVCKLEKALDKACEKLNWDCPVGINLIDDLDCENCCDDTKECWKKYFLNLADVEVIDND